MKDEHNLRGKLFKYVKGGMYLLIILVGILGLALGGVGLWIRVDFDNVMYKQVLDPIFHLCEEEDPDFEFTISAHMDTITYLLIFIGIAIMTTGCVGVCGTVRERTTLMSMFFILLFIILGILLTAGIQAMVKKDTFVKCEKQLAAHLIVATQHYYEDNGNKTFMDEFQRYVGCCGATKGVLDYDAKDGQYPCEEKYFTVPCEQAAKDFFSAVEDNMIMMLVVSFCIGIFTIIGMGMAAYLFFEFRKIKRSL